MNVDEENFGSIPTLILQLIIIDSYIHRSFVIQQIQNSNLFMVVVSNECDCESVSPITMEPIEIRYILYLENNVVVFEVTVYFSPKGIYLQSWVANL